MSELFREDPGEFARSILYDVFKYHKSANWISLNLVSRYCNDSVHPLTPVEALNKILDEILSELQAESKDQAEILENIFWKGQSANQVKGSFTRNTAYSESTFENRYRAARRRYGEILLQKEANSSQLIAAKNKEDSISTSLSKEENDNQLYIKPEVKPKLADIFGSNLAFLRIRPLVVIGVLMLLIGIGAVGVMWIWQTSTQSVYYEPIRRQHPNTQEFVRSQGVSIFTNQNSPEVIPGNFVRTIYIDQNGLWAGFVASEDNTLSKVIRYDKSFWFEYEPEPQIRSIINDITSDNQGRVWIATDGQGVFMFDGHVWHNFTVENNTLPDNRTYTIVEDKKKPGNILVGTWEGIAKFDGQIWSVPYSVSNKTLFSNHVHTIAFSQSGDIWIGHIESGISKFDNSKGKWIYLTKEDGGVVGNQVRSIIIQEAQNKEVVWIATLDGGISRYQGHVQTIYNTGHGLPSNSVKSLAIDKYGRVWAATNLGVVFSMGLSWISYHEFPANDIAFGPSCTNCPIDDDHIWTATENNGLTHSRVPLNEEAITSINVNIPQKVIPGEKFRPEVTIILKAPHTLTNNRDFLSHIDKKDEDRFGAWLLMPVKKDVDSGEPYLFTDYDNPFIAPQLPEGVASQVFTSTWKIWMHTRYIEPPIYITFTVQSTATIGTAELNN